MNRESFLFHTSISHSDITNRLCVLVYRVSPPLSMDGLQLMFWRLQVAVSSEEGGFARVTKNEVLGTLGTPEAVLSVRKGSF